MTWITFTEDVTLEYEASEGPHYRAGYQCDVTGNEARRWFAKGVVTYGRVDLKQPEPAEENAPAETFSDDDFTIPTFAKTKRKRRA